MPADVVVNLASGDISSHWTRDTDLDMVIDRDINMNGSNWAPVKGYRRGTQQHLQVNKINLVGERNKQIADRQTDRQQIGILLRITHAADQL